MAVSNVSGSTGGVGGTGGAGGGNTGVGDGGASGGDSPEDTAGVNNDFLSPRVHPQDQIGLLKEANIKLDVIAVLLGKLVGASEGKSEKQLKFLYETFLRRFWTGGETLASIASKEYYSHEDLDNNEKIYGYDFIIDSEDPDIPYLLKVLNIVIAQNPAIDKSKVKVISVKEFFEDETQHPPKIEDLLAKHGLTSTDSSTEISSLFSRAGIMPKGEGPGSGSSGLSGPGSSGLASSSSPGSSGSAS